jgi:hypothetical protein
MDVKKKTNTQIAAKKEVLDVGKIRTGDRKVTGCDAGVTDPPGCKCHSMGNDPGMWIDKGRPADNIAKGKTVTPVVKAVRKTVKK